MKTSLLLAIPFLFACCTKSGEEKKKGTQETESIQTAAANKPSRPATSTFTKYTIQQGAHECDQRTLRSVSGTTMSFVAKFDSTAIYPPVITDYNHAYDVNKLWGFSEGLNNQYNSARIGWRWLNGELQLFAYVYVNGTLLRDPVSYDPPFIKSVAIGSELNCSIAVSGNTYIFNVDGVTVKTARGTSVSKYQGYQQYPYFGGNLTAPHPINFYIK